MFSTDVAVLLWCSLTEEWLPYTYVIATNYNINLADDNLGNSDIEYMNSNNTNTDDIYLNRVLNEYVKDTETYDNPLIMLSINSKYVFYDIDDLISKYKQNNNPTKIKLNVMHINIQSLSAKFEKLGWTLQENGVELNLILLCETFLHDGNSNLFELPGYNLAVEVMSQYMLNMTYNTTLEFQTVTQIYQ